MRCCWPILMIVGVVNDNTTDEHVKTLASNQETSVFKTFYLLIALPGFYIFCLIYKIDTYPIGKLRLRIR